jgi:hypothetical protein
MKAVLALVVIYIGTFLVAIQGAPQSSAQSAPQGGPQQAAGAATTMDPAKEADIRTLMELVGARDIIQDSVTTSTEQFREKLTASTPNNAHGQAFVNAFVASYQKKYDADAVAEKVVGIYGQHFTDDEIKGMMQFYGSPLGQKVAAEMPKVNHEIQEAARAAGAKASKEAWQAAKEQNPDAGQSAAGLGLGQRRWQQRANSTPSATPAAASTSVPQP